MRDQVEPGLSVLAYSYPVTRIREIAIFAQIVLRLSNRHFHGQNVATVATFGNRDFKSSQPEFA